MGRADVPPQLAAVVDELHAPVFVDEAAVLLPRPQRTGHPGARNAADEVQPIGLEAGVMPGVERGRGGQGVQQRQVAPERGHDADARIPVGEARVNVHTADDEAPHAFLERGREPHVALRRGDRLRPPRREGMNGGGHRRRPVPFRRLDHDPPGFAQRVAHVGDRVAHPGIGLDLGTQELPHDLVGTASLLAGLEDALVGFDDEVAGVGIDEEQLLLDPECDRRLFRSGHAGHHPLPPCGRSGETPRRTRNGCSNMASPSDGGRKSDARIPGGAFPAKTRAHRRRSCARLARDRPRSRP